MAGKTFIEWSLELSPTALRGDRARSLFGGVYALLTDLLAESTRQAVNASKFFSDTFPEDALPRLGNERMMVRYFNEATENYKTRLHGAWDAWQEAGTPIGVEKQLLQFGVTGEVYENYEWDWDSMPDNWSRFWVVITVHPWTSTQTWGDGSTWGDGHAWGSDASVEEVEGIKRLVNDWKRGDTICVHIIIVLDAGVWTPTPTGDWDVAANRNAGAIYWDGV